MIARFVQIRNLYADLYKAYPFRVFLHFHRRNTPLLSESPIIYRAGATMGGVDVDLGNPQIVLHHIQR